nr:MAG TPA: hypothetical protein [Caudoviricetes sp.]
MFSLIIKAPLFLFKAGFQDVTKQPIYFCKF